MLPQWLLPVFAGATVESYLGASHWLATFPPLDDEQRDYFSWMPAPVIGTWAPGCTKGLIVCSTRVLKEGLPDWKR